MAAYLEASKEDDEKLLEWRRRSKRKSMLAKYFSGKSAAPSDERAKQLKSMGYGQSCPGIIRADGVW